MLKNNKERDKKKREKGGERKIEREGKTKEYVSEREEQRKNIERQ